MRRMISERERAPLKNMGFDASTNTVEIGTNAEVDGNLTVNSTISANFITAPGGRVNGTYMGSDIVQADFCTAAAGITISNFSAIKMGKLVFCDFEVVNGTGSTITADATLLTVKEAYRPTHDHRVYVPTARLFIGSGGNVTFGAALSANQSVHVNTFYKIA